MTGAPIASPKRTETGQAARWARWEQWLQALGAEQKRLQVATHPFVRASLERTMGQLQAECAAIEAVIAVLVASDEGLAQKAAGLDF